MTSTDNVLQTLASVIVNRLRINDEYNATLRRDSLKLRDLTAPCLFRVRRIRTDTKEAQGGVLNAYTLIDVESDEEELSIVREIRANGIIPPPIEAGDAIAAYIAPFTYRPAKTGLEIAAKRIARAQKSSVILGSDSLKAILEQEDLRATRILTNPASLSESIEWFTLDHLTYKTMGGWFRRKLCEQENAYALAKVRVDRTHGGISEVSGPNHNLDDQYNRILHLIKEKYE